MLNKRCFSLKELADLTHCQLQGNPQHVIDDVADLETATSQDASFLANPRYQKILNKSKAGIIFVGLETPLSEGINYLISNSPSQAFQKLIDILYPTRQSPSGFKSIHPSAVIHETAELQENVSIGPHAVIDEGVRIGSGSFIGAGTYIGPDTIIGNDCTIHPRVVIRENCEIGHRVIIQPGAVIGSCGFGYITNKQGKHLKLNQVGNVSLADDVEIGANTTIDRARFKSTQIGQGSKLDNLVQIGHGVSIGPDNIIVAQTGIAGSTSTGKSVVLAGHVAVAGHLHLDDEVIVAGKSGVTKSLSKGKYGGMPALPIHDYHRTQVFMHRIEEYVKQIKDLTLKINEIEKYIKPLSKL